MTGATPRSPVVCLAGGVGGAKLAEGLQAALGDVLTVVVNTADDTDRHGLLVCPDHDTVMYTLAYENRARLGIAGTLQAAMGARALRRGGLVPARRPDLATHVVRTRLLREGLADRCLPHGGRLGVRARSS
jgi:LPPG:FO 2-phospho-L-lactate transferase